MCECGAPFRKVGWHRRMRMDDVLRYKASTCANRKGELEQIVADSEAIGAYDL
jgi:hypothetical protein